jgi:hypothetical protein
MGTMREWVDVGFSSIFWGGWMLIWESRKRKAANLKPVILPASILIWALSGLGFGLAMGFGSKALQWPLAIAIAASFAGALVISVVFNRERDLAFNQPPIWLRIVSFFLIVGAFALLAIDKATPIAYLAFIAVGVLNLLDYFQFRDRGLHAPH